MNVQIHEKKISLKERLHRMVLGNSEPECNVIAFWSAYACTFTKTKLNKEIREYYLYLTLDWVRNACLCEHHYTMVTSLPQPFSSVSSLWTPPWLPFESHPSLTYWLVFGILGFRFICPSQVWFDSSLSHPNISSWNSRTPTHSLNHSFI